MTTDGSAGTTSEVVRSSLVALSERLEPLWREAAERRPTAPALVADHDPWDVAAARLTGALVALEHYAASVDPALGRRDWVARPPRAAVLPRQRLPLP